MRVTNESEVFDLIDLSIRATLIVSDEEGIDFVRQYISGFNVNNSILNIAFYSDDDNGTEAMEKVYEEAKHERGNEDREDHTDLKKL